MLNNADIKALSSVTKSLAGPALCGMIAGIVAILAFGPELPWPLWSAATEAIRAHYVGGIGVALALMVGVLVWRLDGSKLDHIEIKSALGSVVMGDRDDKVG